MNSSRLLKVINTSRPKSVIGLIRSNSHRELMQPSLSARADMTTLQWLFTLFLKDNVKRYFVEQDGVLKNHSVQLEQGDTDALEPFINRAVQIATYCFFDNNHQVKTWFRQECELHQNDFKMPERSVFLQDFVGWLLKGTANSQYAENKLLVPPYQVGGEYLGATFSLVDEPYWQTERQLDNERVAEKRQLARCYEGKLVEQYQLVSQSITPCLTLLSEPTQYADNVREMLRLINEMNKDNCQQTKAKLNALVTCAINENSNQTNTEKQFIVTLQQGLQAADLSLASRNLESQLTQVKQEMQINQQGNIARYINLLMSAKWSMLGGGRASELEQDVNRVAVAKSIVMVK